MGCVDEGRTRVDVSFVLNKCCVDGLCLVAFHPVTTVLCMCARHLTLIRSLSSHVYK